MIDYKKILEQYLRITSDVSYQSIYGIYPEDMPSLTDEEAYALLDIIKATSSQPGFIGEPEGVVAKRGKLYTLLINNKHHYDYPEDDWYITINGNSIEEIIEKAPNIVLDPDRKLQARTVYLFESNYLEFGGKRFYDYLVSEDSRYGDLGREASDVWHLIVNSEKYLKRLEYLKQKEREAAEALKIERQKNDEKAEYERYLALKEKYDRT